MVAGCVSLYVGVLFVCFCSFFVYSSPHPHLHLKKQTKKNYFFFSGREGVEVMLGGGGGVFGCVDVM